MQDATGIPADRWATRRATPRARCWGSVLWLTTLLCASGFAATPARFEVGLIGDLPYTGEDEAKFPSLMMALDAPVLSMISV